MKSNLSKVFWCLCLCAILLSAPLQADTRAEYERYVATYNEYRNAITEKRSEAEIKELQAEFKAAKAQYEGNFSKTTDTPFGVTTQDEAQAPANTDTEEKIKISDLDSEEPQAKKVTKLPSGLEKILRDLWSEKGRKNPDAAMKLLTAYIKANPGSKFNDFARYELAKAYELLKDDNKRAELVLKTIGTRNPNSKYAKLAKERMKYLAAGKQYKQWQQALGSSYGVSQDKYSKYRETSWLAFPVKVTRWFGYAGKLVKFNKNQDNFEKFMIYYENLGAKFAPPVEVTFDKFKVAVGETTTDSDVSLHYYNPSAWYSRWKILSEAQHSIDIQYFIVNKDIFGMSLLGMLYKKAKEGLKIRIMMDSRGTKALTKKLQGQDYLQELVEMPNVEVKVFNPYHSNLVSFVTDFRKIMSSNHDKILVVDEEYAIVGGRNISIDYFLSRNDHPSSFRDCDVVIKNSEVAQQLSYAFDEEFAKKKTFVISKELWGNIDIMSDDLWAAYDVMESHIRNEPFKMRKDANNKYVKAAAEWNSVVSEYKDLKDYTGFDPFENSYQCPVKIIDKHSLGGPRNDITDQMIKYIDGCKKEVLIQNPYVVLTDRMFAALKRAGERGVKVIIHTNSPYSTDSLATQAMFYADFKRIMKDIPGVRVFVFYKDGKLHAKNWVFDSKIGVVGTYNLDYMSEQINSEVVAAVRSTGFAKELRNEIMSDIADSKEYEVEVNDKGEVKTIVGPDDIPGKNFWLLKTLSKFTVFKKLI